MTKKIASVYYDSLTAERPLYGGYYRVPAIEVGGEPVVITIEDKIQRSQEAGPDGKSRVLARYPVSARDIAHDLIREWTTNALGMSPECHPGIWIVRDEVPLLNPDGSPEIDADKKAQWREATTEEKAAMWAEDVARERAATARWAEWNIQKGDVFAEDPKERIMISPLMKLSARKYGRDRAWLSELKDSDVKSCPFCTQNIPSHAVKCPKCQEIVDRERYEQMTQPLAGAPVRPPVQKPQAVRA